MQTGCQRSPGRDAGSEGLQTLMLHYVAHQAWADSKMRTWGRTRSDLLEQLRTASGEAKDDCAAKLEALVFREEVRASERAWGLRVNPPGTPMQINGLDCGVCVAQCARHLCSVPPDALPQFPFTGMDVDRTLRRVMGLEIAEQALETVEACMTPPEQSQAPDKGTATGGEAM